MAKFHITIKNNETGEIMHDSDTKAILGAFDSQDKTECIAALECNPVTLASTLNGAECVLDDIRNKFPEADALSKLIDKYFNKKTDKKL